MKLRARLALWLFLAMAVVATLLLAYFQVRVDDLQAREGDARITTLTTHLAASSVLAVLTGNAELVGGVLRSALNEPDVVGVTLVDEDGNVVAREADADFSPPALVDTAVACSPCVLDARHLRWTAPVERLGGPVEDDPESFYDAPPAAEDAGARVGWVVVDVSTRGRLAARTALLRDGAMLAALVLLIALAFTFLASRRLSAPLLELAAATRQIGRGQWDAPVPKNAEGEIRELADDLEAMATALAALDAEASSYRQNLEAMVESRTEELQVAHDRMKALLESKDQFVRTVSHDFRSPLAVVLSSVQTVLRDPDMSPDVRRRFLANAELQCKRLEALVTNLLDLARLEQTDADLPVAALAPCVEDAIAAHRRQCEEAGIELVCAADDIAGLSLPLDSPLVSLALDNLIGNARKFTPTGGRIEVTARTEAGYAHLRVQDSGPGIAQADLARVFEPFFQGESGARRGEGFGLGLSIVRGVAQRHGGEVDVRSVDGEGACFELRLPLDLGRDTGGADGDDSDHRR